MTRIEALLRWLFDTTPRHARGEAVVRMKGEWCDVRRRFDEHGDLTHLVNTGWRPNQVQNTNAQLLASLMKKQAGLEGIQYIAIGSGQASWDAGAPTQDAGDTTLDTELYRQAVPAVDISFRDAGTLADIDPTPSNVIQVDATIGLADAVGTHREFGLFGGDASGAADSGYMVNWIVTPRIDKDALMTIQRTIRFTFAVV